MAVKSVKATANSAMRSKAMMVITVFTIFALFSIAMSIYNMANENKLFGVLFGIVAFIFVVLVLLKVNSVFGTYIKAKNETLYLKSWVNNFLPYNADGGFFADLKPSKTKLIEIPVEDISAIYVGTKDFIKRNASASDKKLIKALYPYEHSSKKSRKSLIAAIDLFYVETYDGESSFMCIYGYDVKKVVDVIAYIYEGNPDLYVKVSNREYKNYVKKFIKPNEE